MKKVQTQTTSATQLQKYKNLLSGITRNEQMQKTKLQNIVHSLSKTMETRAHLFVEGKNKELKTAKNHIESIFGENGEQDRPNFTP